MLFRSQQPARHCRRARRLFVASQTSPLRPGRPSTSRLSASPYLTTTESTLPCSTLLSDQLTTQLDQNATWFHRTVVAIKSDESLQPAHFAPSAHLASTKASKACLPRLPRPVYPGQRACRRPRRTVTLLLPPIPNTQVTMKFTLLASLAALSSPVLAHPASPLAVATVTEQFKNALLMPVRRSVDRLPRSEIQN